MKLRPILVTAAVAATAALAVAAALGIGGGDGSPLPEATGPGPKTVQVTRGTLTDARTVDGTLGFGAEQPIAAKATGTVTWLPVVGTTIGRGEAIARVDDLPVVLLFGALPAYRPLANGVKGADVKQFESNLVALGYAGFTVDETYSSATADVVKRWQRKLGWSQTGSVEPSQIVYAAGTQRVARQLVRVGAASGGDVLAVTDQTKVISLTVPLTESWAKLGTKVTVELPSGPSVPAEVTRIGAGPDTTGSGIGSGAGDGGGAGASGTPIEVTVVDQSALTGLDGGRVSIRYVQQERTNVLSVPVAALIALAEGGYGLEVVDGASTKFIAVTTGLFADGRVEISGPAVREGLTVRIPA